MKMQPPTPEFEQQLRRRLTEFADRAPTAVRQPDDLAISRVDDASDERGIGATRRRIAGIGAAVIALGGGVALTTVAATGGDDGGANTPEDAVLEFIEAVEQRDVIGAIDVLDPAESRVMVDAVRDIAGEAKRVGLLSGGADLNDVAGTTVDIDGLMLSSEAIGTDLTLVHLASGRADVQLDFASLPFGASLNNAIARVGDAPTVERLSIELADADLSIATVLRDERWYVSVGFTLAETIRSSTGWPSPLDAGVVAEGFDTPEAAATAFWTRLGDFDIDGAIATAAPGEGDALARYASLWVPDAERGLADARADGFDLAIAGLEFDVSGDGASRTVEPTAYRVVGTLPPLEVGEGMPPFDETWPTVVFTTDGSGFYVIAAGDPIPDSFDDLEIMAEFDPGSLSIDDWNTATLLPNGTLQTFWSDPGDATPPETPRPFTLDFADDCTTVSGGLSASDGQFGRFGSTSVEELDNGDLRSCGATDAFTTLGSIAFFFGAGSPPAIPAIGVSEVDGRWYVSPVGSVGAMVLEVMAGMDDDGALAFGSPLGSIVYGASPAMLEQMLVGQNLADLSDACRTTVVAGNDGTVTDLVEAPSVESVQDCLYDGPFDTFGGPVGPPVEMEAGTEMEAVTEIAPAPSTVVLEQD